MKKTSHVNPTWILGNLIILFIEKLSCKSVEVQIHSCKSIFKKPQFPRKAAWRWIFAGLWKQKSEANIMNYMVGGSNKPLPQWLKYISYNKSYKWFWVATA